MSALIPIFTHVLKFHSFDGDDDYLSNVKDFSEQPSMCHLLSALPGWDDHGPTILALFDQILLDQTAKICD